MSRLHYQPEGQASLIQYWPIEFQTSPIKKVAMTFAPAYRQVGNAEFRVSSELKPPAYAETSAGWQSLKKDQII